MGVSGKTLSKLEVLQKKFEREGQNIDNYLDGLINSEYLSYWNYIGLDTLIGNQQTLTNFPDEKIFLVYHQHTELLFNLCLHELEQITVLNDVSELKIKLDRLIRYFEILVDSFRIIYDGLDTEQFWKFRTTLHPASGFQSVQFRKIELISTGISNLVATNNFESENSGLNLEQLYQKLYWKVGGTNKNTGEKNITLKRFEEKYDSELIFWTKKYSKVNVWDKYLKIEDGSKEIKSLLKKYDHLVNVDWGLIHFKVVEKHLNQKKSGIKATGGTNWKKYLDPGKRKRMFYPELWTETEKEEWGNLAFEKIDLV